MQFIQSSALSKIEKTINQKVQREARLCMSLQGSTAFILKNDWVKIAKKKYKKKRTKGNFPYEMLKCTIKKKHYNNESIVEKK